MLRKPSPDRNDETVLICFQGNGAEVLKSILRRFPKLFAQRLGSLPRGAFLLFWISLAFVSDESAFNRSGSAYGHSLAGFQHRCLATADGALLGTCGPCALRASPFWRLARRTQQLALISLHGLSLRPSRAARFSKLHHTGRAWVSSCILTAEPDSLFCGVCFVVDAYVCCY